MKISARWLPAVAVIVAAGAWGALTWERRRALEAELAEPMSYLDMDLERVERQLADFRMVALPRHREAWSATCNPGSGLLQRSPPSARQYRREMSALSTRLAAFESGGVLTIFDRDDPRLVHLRAFRRWVEREGDGPLAWSCDDLVLPARLDALANVLAQLEPCVHGIAQQRRPVVQRRGTHEVLVIPSPVTSGPVPACDAVRVTVLPEEPTAGADARPVAEPLETSPRDAAGSSLHARATARPSSRARMGRVWRS